jgi:putative methionine-R-sulfoxide reductase with GAF domain
MMKNKDENEVERLNKIVAIQQRLMSDNFDLDEFMNLIVNEIQTLTPATGVVIELADGDEMVYRAAVGYAESFLGLRLPLKNSISGLCVESNKILISEDTENDARVNLEACRKVKARSLVVAPLFNCKMAVGVLKIMSDQPYAFNETDIKMLQLMAGFLGSALASQIRKEVRNFF